MDVADEILRLEIALAHRDEAAIPGGYEAVLDESFEEVGQSGRVWTRATMLAALRAESPTDAIELTEFTVTGLGPDAFLARYDTVTGLERTHRSSIWLRSAGSGRPPRIRFHQGTPAPGDR